MGRGIKREEVEGDRKMGGGGELEPKEDGGRRREVGDKGRDEEQRGWRVGRERGT